MKRLMIVSTLFMLLFTASMAQAESHGSAVSPPMFTWYVSGSVYNSCEIMLSNIAESEVECTIHFFDHDGNDMGSQAKIYKGALNSGSEPLVATGAVFTMPANSTRAVVFSANTPRIIRGYAVVEWKSTNPKLAKALMGAIRQYGKGSSSSYSGSYSAINGGQPF